MNKLLKILPLCALLFVAGCNTSSPSTDDEVRDEVERVSFTLNTSVAELYIGETLQLEPKIYVSNTTLSWLSSNNNVATVNDNGLVTAIGEGEVIISAYDDVAVGKCTIRVSKDTSAALLEFENDNITIATGSYYNVVPMVTLNGVAIDADFSYDVELFSETTETVTNYQLGEFGYRFYGVHVGTAVYSFSTIYNGNRIGNNVTITVIQGE